MQALFLFQSKSVAHDRCAAQTYGYLPNYRVLASPPIGRFDQITLLDDRGQCVPIACPELLIDTNITELVKPLKPPSLFLCFIPLIQQWVLAIELGQKRCLTSFPF